MTDEQTNQLFAEKIWGWHLRGIYWEDENNDPVGTKLDYTPSTNFLQAFEALEKFCEDDDYSIELDWDGVIWSCIILNNDSLTIGYSSELDKTTAICNTLIEALKASNDKN